MNEDDKIVLKGNLMQNMTQEDFLIFCQGNQAYHIVRNEVGEIIIQVKKQSEN